MKNIKLPVYDIDSDIFYAMLYLLNKQSFLVNQDQDESILFAPKDIHIPTNLQKLLKPNE